MATKDISDVEVLRAVADFRASEEMDRPVNPRQIFGMAKPEKETRWPYVLLMERTGQPMKVCYRAMERADDRGLLEYGVSLRTAWITEKGRALLASAEKRTGAAEKGSL